MKYINGSESITFKLNDKEITKNTNVLIFASLNEDFVYDDKVLYPDLVIDYIFSTSGKFELYNSSNELIDSVTFDTYISRVGYSDNEGDNFVSTVITPTNSRGEGYEVRTGVNDKVIATEVAILKIPSELVKSDEIKQFIEQINVN